MQDDRLDASIANALVRLFRLVNRVHNRGLRAAGLSAEQAHVLSVLWIRGPMTIGQLQRQLALSSATLTGAIDRMEAQRLVRRVPSAADGRAFVIEPRTSGKQRVQIETVLAAGEERCFGALSERDRVALLRLLQACAAGIEPEAVSR